MHFARLGHTLQDKNEDPGEACFCVMKEFISPGNVIEALKLAREYERKGLKKECFRKIGKFIANDKINEKTFESLYAEPGLMAEIICGTNRPLF